MHCTLLIPDLLPPREFGAEPFAGLRVTALSELLARGRIIRRPAVAREDWLCDRFGVAAQQDRPLAALMLKADGGDPAGHYWLCADPIQLRVDRNRLIVAGRAVNFTGDETRGLMTALNRHFAVDGMAFHATKPDRWYLRTSRVPQLVTTPLGQALNQSVTHHLPHGADALAWHRVMNEAQMILHAHPANAAREARGAIAANSIWLSGGGTIPAIARPAYTAAWGGGELMHALAAGAGIAHDEMPATGVAWLDRACEGHHLLEIDIARETLREQGSAAWRRQLIAIDDLWLRPLLDALRARRMDELTIAACNHDGLLEVAIARADLRRFWRRARPLAAYV